MEFSILYEDAWVLVAVKPFGCPSQPDKTGDEDLLSMLTAYLKQKGEKFDLSIINRLDRPIGGVVLFAKTPQAASILSKAMTEGLIKKEYLAIVTGLPKNTEGELEDYLFKNGKTNISVVVNKEKQGAKKAKLAYHVLGNITKEENTLSLLRIRLLTGRHHQIRVQLAHAGTGIWGDKKYNITYNPIAEQTQPALWAYRLEFVHPKTNKQISITQTPTAYPFTKFDLEKLL